MAGEEREGWMDRRRVGRGEGRVEEGERMGTKREEKTSSEYRRK